MTPLGHVAVALCVARIVEMRSRRVPIVAVVLGAMAPDFDVVLLPFGNFNELHRVISHNVFYLCFVALGLALTPLRMRGAASAFGAGMLHLLVDAVMDNNPSNGMGVAWIWPLSDSYLHPFNLLEVIKDSRGWDAPLQHVLTLLPGLVWEVPWVALALLAYQGRARDWMRPRLLLGGSSGKR